MQDDSIHLLVVRMHGRCRRLGELFPYRSQYKLLNSDHVLNQFRDRPTLRRWFEMPLRVRQTFGGSDDVISGLLQV